MFFIRECVCSIFQSSHLPDHVQVQWLMSALGSYSRAANRLITRIETSDLYDPEQCRTINEQIMGVTQNSSWLYQHWLCRWNPNNPWCVCSLQVERNLLSPYVSPRDAPFRHILLGSGSHTLGAVFTHLASIQSSSMTSTDVVLLNNQIAMAAWVIQSCASALVQNVWDTENELDSA